MAGLGGARALTVKLGGLAVLVASGRGTCEAILRPRCQQDSVGFDAVWWRWCQGPGHGSQPPLLHVGLDEDESGLTKVDVDDARPVRAEGWEEVLRLQAVDHVLQSLAVPREEYCPRPRSVANTNNVALDNLRTVRGCVERLVIAARAS